MADTPNDPQDAALRASHVRSFAKDMERLSGKKPENMTPVVQAPPVPPKPVAPPPPPPAPTPEPVPLPPLSVQKDIKQDVLERLRAKVSQYQKEPEPSIVRTPETPPIPLSKPPTPEKVAPIHTYKSDFADHIDSDKASVFSVLAAEKDSTEVTPEVLAKKKSNRTKYIVGVMLLLLGIVGVYAAYRWAHNLSVVPTEDAVPSLVFADARKELGGTGDALFQSLADVAKTDLPQGNVLITYVTTATSTEKGIIKYPQPGGVLISKLGLKAPDILLRNIEDASTVGVIHAGEESRVFFVLRVSSYERTFAGMLEWEKTIIDDLALLYPGYPENAPVDATATSTPVAPPPPRFVDDVVASRDVRALRDYRNRTILLYGYRDKETLIIARDEQAFAQLVGRLAATDAR